MRAECLAIAGLPSASGRGGGGAWHRPDPRTSEQHTHQGRQYLPELRHSWGEASLLAKPKTIGRCCRGIPASALAEVIHSSAVMCAVHSGRTILSSSSRWALMAWCSSARTSRAATGDAWCLPPQRSADQRPRAEPQAAPGLPRHEGRGGAAWATAKCLPRRGGGAAGSGSPRSVVRSVPGARCPGDHWLPWRGGRTRAACTCEPAESQKNRSRSWWTCLSSVRPGPLSVTALGEDLTPTRLRLGASVAVKSNETVSLTGLALVGWVG